MYTTYKREKGLSGLNQMIHQNYSLQADMSLISYIPSLQVRELKSCLTFLALHFPCEVAIVRNNDSACKTE